MKVAVVGLWHLGLVTAACLAQLKHDVLAYDADNELISQLKAGKSPLFEPGLDELLAEGIKNQTLSYSANSADIQQADIIWVNIDTPVNDNDVADIDFVVKVFETVAPHVSANALVLFSSQLPVGTTRNIQQNFYKSYPEKKASFGYIPENLRLGKAIKVFTQPDRFVVGLQHKQDQVKVQQLLGAITTHFVWMSIESAEMTKHALNSFLALSVTFINEIASLCEKTGADASEVEAGLKSEERIGQNAYLRAGGAIAGGTLLRDINYLTAIGEHHQRPVPLLSAVLDSNARHKQWVQDKISEVFKPLKNITIAVLGLTYKVNTDTLRRSSSVETCQWLSAQGVKVNAFDPAINVLPDEYAAFIHLKLNVHEALATADAVVIATEWPEFRNLDADHFIKSKKQAIILDPNGFLFAALANDPRIRYCSVGRN